MALRNTSKQTQDAALPSGGIANETQKPPPKDEIPTLEKTAQEPAPQILPLKGTDEVRNVPAPTMPNAPEDKVEPARVPVRTASQINDYIVRYDGRDCFVAWPTDASSKPVKIAGIGVNADIFNKFNADFHFWSGGEPVITMRLIEPEQCAAAISSCFM